MGEAISSDKQEILINEAMFAFNFQPPKLSLDKPKGWFIEGRIVEVVL